MKHLLLGVLLVALPLQARAQQPDRPGERTVVVSATATVEREPERAVVLLAVESTGQTARAATQANATRMDAVIAALRRLGLSGRNVRTTSYQLHPEYARQDRGNEAAPPRIIGYRASNMVQVTVDTIARVGGVIDAAIAAGANRVANLHFELRDPQAARTEALRLAVARARSEAEAMAQAGGGRLGPVLNMTTGSFAIPRYAADMAVAEMRMAQAAPTPIEPGTLSVMANVTVTFRLEGS